MPIILCVCGGFKILKSVFRWISVCFLPLSLSLQSAQEAFPLSCSDTLRESTTLKSDLICSEGGLVIAANGVVLDLGGYTVRGPGRGQWVWPERALSSIGVRVTGKSGVTIRNGRVTNFATGILLEDTSKVTIEEVSSNSNHYGIYLFRGQGNTLSKVNVSDNIYGLHLQDTEENRVTRSVFFRSHYGSPGGYGINLYRSDRNTITGNRIELNENQGIWLIDSRDNMIYRNNFIRNSPNAVDGTGVNLWYDPEQRKGNYWSDYKGSGPYSVRGPGGAKDLYPASEEIALEG